MEMTRKEFLGLGLGLAAAGLAACGGGDSSGGGTSGGNCLDNGGDASIAANHGHSMSVSAADVAAGKDKTYDIQGSAAHDHTVALTAAHFATLAENKSVSVTSSTTNGHSHSVTVTCA